MPKKQAFTETFLQGLLKKPPPARVFYTETGRKGFQLRHEPGGSLSWYVRYQRNGAPCPPVHIGTYPATSLARAHKIHIDMREQLGQGLDPAVERKRVAREREIEERKRERTEAITARRVIAEWGWHFARRKRKRPREAVRLLRVNLASWDGRPAGELVKRDAVLLLDRLTGRGSLVMANRIRDLANQCFNFAIARDLIEVNPFAGVSKPGGKETAKDRNLTADEIRASWQALDAPATKMSGVVRLCIKLVLTTAQRPGECIGATWAEFHDLDGSEPRWIIPAERSKVGKQHCVPLSDLAVEILTQLRELQKDEPRPCVVPSHMSKVKPEEPLSEKALSRALRNNIGKDGKLFACEPWTPHDARRTAATMMTQLGTSRVVVGKILGHVNEGTTSIYDRNDYMPERRKALQQWADELRSIVAGKNHKVVPIRKARA